MQVLTDDVLGVIALNWDARFMGLTCRALYNIRPDPSFWVEFNHAVCDCGCIPAARVTLPRMPNGVFHGYSIISCGLNYSVCHEVRHDLSQLISITSRVYGDVYARVEVVGPTLFEWFAFSKQVFSRQTDGPYSINTGITLDEFNTIVDNAISDNLPGLYSGVYTSEVGCLGTLPQCSF